MRTALAVPALLVALVPAACGGARAAGSPPLLPAGALPQLVAATRDVSASDLAAEVGASEQAVVGLVAARERVFQGESHRLDRVVSRTLEFDDAGHARAYVALLHSRLFALYGAGTTASPLVSGGRTGYLIDPAACACHRAAPTLTAALVRGDRVTYLEINGDGATTDALDALLAQAP